MTTDAMQHNSFAFGEYRLDAVRGALLRKGVEVRLRPQSFEVLRFLVENANRLVTKEEIFAAVWAGSVVTDDSLTQCLIDIRRALGDEAREVVRTVPRRGYVFEMPVTESGAINDGDLAARAGSPGARRWLLAAAAIAVAATVAWWILGQPPVETSASSQPAPPDNSIAVLAFADMSEGRDHEHFADGMAEEILNLLTRIPNLQVIARTSSFSFKGSDADVIAIGKALDAGYVLEGSVRPAGERVRVTAQLVDARTGVHVWSEAYDRKLDDLLDVQSSIAESVARSLEITFAEGSLASGTRAVNPEAYEHVLHGRFLHNRRSPGDLAAAEQHFRQAVALDEHYAAAWAGLAGSVLVGIFSDGRGAAVGLEDMRLAVTRALALDPSLPESLVRAAQYHFHTGNFTESSLMWERARALEPDHPMVLGGMSGDALARGDYAQAVELSRRAVQLDPLNATSRSNFAWNLTLDGHYDEAARELERAKQLNPLHPSNAINEGELLILRGQYDEALALISDWPDGPRRERGLALAYRELGRTADADAQVARLRQRSDRERAGRLAEIHAQRGENDEAFAWLAIAQDAERGAALTPGLAAFPFEASDAAFLKPLRGDPRWAQYVRQRPR